MIAVHLSILLHNTTIYNHSQIFPLFHICLSRGIRLVLAAAKSYSMLLCLQVVGSKTNQTSAFLVPEFTCRWSIMNSPFGWVSWRRFLVVGSDRRMRKILNVGIAAPLASKDHLPCKLRHMSRIYTSGV